ncbi:hypothetical protein V2G26_007145 [Clonostachys chloroleuca]
MLSLSYQSLGDFTGLPDVRKAIARGDRGLLVFDLPAFKKEASIENLPHGVKLQKNDIPTSSPPSLSAVVAVMEILHQYSQTIFKNISHAVELPWEKYLGEMHEFMASGKDELRTIPPREPLPNEWSTLTIVMNSSKPQQALVLFGTALSVFTEGMTVVPTGSDIDIESLSKIIGKPQGDWIVYYVRPNDDVFYIRTAGALMTPLSTAEYAERQRTKDVETAR